MRLTIARDQFADASRIFRKNILALGFADLLQNHLLRGLRRNPAQSLGRLREANFRIDLSVGADLSCAASSEISLSGSTTSATTFLTP